MMMVMEYNDGMLTGSVLAAYINFGVSASHLLSASVMSAPAALAFSKLTYPETKKSKTTAEALPKIESKILLTVKQRNSQYCVFS